MFFFSQPFRPYLSHNSWVWVTRFKLCNYYLVYVIFGDIWKGYQFRPKIQSEVHSPLIAGWPWQQCLQLPLDHSMQGCKTFAKRKWARVWLSKYFIFTTYTRRSTAPPYKYWSFNIHWAKLQIMNWSNFNLEIIFSYSFVKINFKLWTWIIILDICMVSNGTHWMLFNFVSIQHSCRDDT